ncbi:hypothetical protein JCM11641_006779 [Rhodosporidiobolus odoratus]
MHVHPSRAQHVPQDQSRPRANDLDSPPSNSHSHSHHPHSPTRQTPPHLRQRRPSPSYGEYDDPSRRSQQEEDRDRRDRDARIRDRDYRDDDRERRAIEHETRRGGGYGGRLTPERELEGRDNGYGRGGGGGGGGGRGGYGARGGYANGNQGGNRDDYFESRRKQREESNLTIWPPSPRSPAPDSDAEDRKKSKSSKSKSSSSRHKSSRHRSSRSSSNKKHYSSSSDSDSDDDDRRRSSDKKRSSHRSSSSRHKSSSSSSRRDRDRSPDRERDRGEKRRKRSLSPLSEGEEENGRSSKRREREGSTVGAAAGSGLVPTAAGAPGGDEEDEWVEKAPLENASGAGIGGAGDSDSDNEVGPMPLSGAGASKTRNAYGGALRPGEGSAIAAYVESGERIPRRGEIGLNPDTIDKWEASGYVMSGSRHKRMNAVRVRKENQVISAEEKRGILQLAAAEKLKRENEIVASFRELVDEKLQKQTD